MSEHEFTPQAMEAATAIIARYPELQSTNVDLLTKLLALAWLEGRLTSISANVAVIEATLGLS